MGQQGQELTYEEMRKQAVEGLRVINELKKENESLKKRIEEEMELRRNADTENEQLKEKVKSLHDRLAEAYRIAGKELEE